MWRDQGRWLIFCFGWAVNELFGVLCVVCGWLVVFFPCFPFEGPCAYLMSTLDSARVLFGGFSMLWCLSIKKKKKNIARNTNTT